MLLCLMIYSQPLIIKNHLLTELTITNFHYFFQIITNLYWHMTSRIGKHTMKTLLPIYMYLSYMHTHVNRYILLSPAPMDMLKGVVYDIKGFIFFSFSFFLLEFLDKSNASSIVHTMMFCLMISS
jgi:hypothetical protein